ncbi:hypothetical protein [Croceivirga thetidis]|uniref:HEAT repeat domain-containing protein n=1 Tax=Croceivirga thetidis TaxID=2721623 RepID=A0ABX1GRU1_9FLAO|nr:hypothetical protein [Croceivirga thetidis]NKI32324.1 hypothetical protein [Croceivirga thetidis]
MSQASKIIISFLVKLIVLAVFLIPSDSNAQRRSTSVNINSNGKTTISIKNGLGNNFAIEYKGEIELANDDSDIVSISRGGYFEIKKTAFGSRRKVFIEPNGSGGLIKKYYTGGSQQSFDPEGKKWLSEVLFEVVRTTTLGAEKRVDRIYKKEGYYPVLKFVDEISSDHVKSRYLKLLLEKKLDERGLIGALKRVADIDSDHHKAEILKHSSRAFLTSEAVTASYIETTGKINSDHHKAEVLKRSIEDRAISDNQMKALFQITDDINSDHHKASVLTKVLNSRTLNAENTKLLIATANSINSDHHKANVLKRALSSKELSSSSYHTLISSMDNINSDHHMASVFNELLRNNLNDEALAHLLKQVKQNISSDMHQATVLKKVVQEQDVKGVMDSFLSALQSVNSDHHKAEVFKALARHSYSDNDLISILETTKNINSDHHHAEILIAFAPMVRGKSERVLDAYHDSSDAISSDAHLGRTLKALR